MNSVCFRSRLEFTTHPNRGVILPTVLHHASPPAYGTPHCQGYWLSPDSAAINSDIVENGYPRWQAGL